MQPEQVFDLRKIQRIRSLGAFYKEILSIVGPIGFYAMIYKTTPASFARYKTVERETALNYLVSKIGNIAVKGCFREYLHCLLGDFYTDVLPIHYREVFSVN